MAVLELQEGAPFSMGLSAFPPGFRHSFVFGGEKKSKFRGIICSCQVCSLIVICSPRARDLNETNSN